MTTPLYPAFDKRITDATNRLIREQVTPWSFMNAGPPFAVRDFHGKQIAYQGIGFEGSPSHIFWGRGYMPPFLEELAVTEIRAAVNTAKERGVDGREVLAEVQGLLIASSRRVYDQMADVDRRLRGKGFPKSVNLRPVDDDVHTMEQFILKHVRAELTMWNPKSRFEIWYERNKFWVWIIGGVCGFAAAIVLVALKWAM